MTPKPNRAERETRKLDFRTKLDAAGWHVRERAPATNCTGEEETVNEPADYALWLDNQVANVLARQQYAYGCRWWRQA
jgi:hypothetical protein